MYAYTQMEREAFHDVTDKFFVYFSKSLLIVTKNVANLLKRNLLLQYM